MQHLAQLRLVERVSPTSWRLALEWTAHLRELGTRGDIIKQMHAVLHGDPARYRVLDHTPTATAIPPPPLYGRVAQKGLADELRGSFYAVIETPDGAGYHVPLGNRAAEQLRRGDLVAFSPAPAKDAPAPARRVPAQARVVVRYLSLPFADQVHHPGPVWLDHVDPRSLAAYGLGATVRQHLEDRHAHLRKLGVDPLDPNRLAALQELERRAVGEGIAAQRGLAFVQATPDGFRGRLGPPVQGADGTTYAVVSDGARAVVTPVCPDARLRNGQSVTLARDASGNLTLRPVDKERDMSR